MSANKNLAGKVALVTGSSRGTGAAIAPRLAQHGANIAVNYVNPAAAAEKVAEQIRAFNIKAITIKADVPQEVEVKALFENVMQEFGRDIVMSNSGIEHFSAIPDVTGEEERYLQFCDLSIPIQ